MVLTVTSKFGLARQSAVVFQVNSSSTLLGAPMEWRTTRYKAGVLSLQHELRVGMGTVSESGLGRTAKESDMSVEAALLDAMLADAEALGSRPWVDHVERDTNSSEVAAALLDDQLRSIASR